MKIFKINHCILLVIAATSLLACTEAYEIQSDNFESLLVVEATITNEMKRQEIKLSKTFKLENDEPNQVSNAQVGIETGSGIQYNFEQTQPGIYTSNDAFQAQPGETYTLQVVLSDGRTYVSTAEILPPTTEIESLEASLETVDGEQGIQIYANSSSNVGDAVYFKYDYEETYKIVTPLYNPFDLIITAVDSLYTGYYELEFELKPEDVKTCYSTKMSTDIIQTSLSDSQNNSVERFPVRFIKNNNPIIRERYSILVTQNVQSLEAYNFYKILKEIGTIENLFTDNQPGFIQGNMRSSTNEEENVIGFFQVSSVSTKRIYFNYDDFNIPLPPYFYDCNIYEDLDYTDNTSMDGDRNDYVLIYSIINSGTYKYFSGIPPLYTLVLAECGDCTLFSSTVIPEFWED